MLNRDDILLTQEQIWGKYRVFGKTLKLANKPMQSLLGKQNDNIIKTGTSSSVIAFGNKKMEIGAWTTTPKIPNISVYQNHKYAFITLWNKIQSNRDYAGHLYFTFSTRQELTGVSRYLSNNKMVVVGTCTNDNNGNMTIEDESSAFNISLDDIKGYALIDLTEYGLDNLTAQQFYDQYNMFFDKLANGDTLPAIYSATSPLSFYKGNTIVRTFTPSPAITLSGIGTAKDYWQNWNGKVNRVIENVDLGSLDWQTGTYESVNAFYTTISDLIETRGSTMFCSIYTSMGVVPIRDLLDKTMTNFGDGRVFIRNDDYTDATAFKTAMSGVILHYELATPTTETINSLMLPKGITKCTDANGVELEIENI